MPVEQLLFNGINRAVSDYASNGACEELINLRPTTAGLVPVKPANPKISSLDYERVYEHKVSGGDNLIGIKIENGALKAYPCDDPQARAIFEVPGVSDVSALVGFATVEDLAFFSIIAEGGIYVNVVLRWDGQEYQTVEANAPELNVSFSRVDLKVAQYEGTLLSAEERSDYTKVSEAIRAGLDAIQVQNKDYCFGPTVVAIVFKTSDGKILWTDKWHILNPVATVYEADPDLHIGGMNPYLVQNNNRSLYSDFQTLIDFYGKAFVAHATQNIGVNPKSITFAAGAKVSMTVALATGASWNEYSSIIKSVEIYASRPKLYVDPDNMKGETATVSGDVITLLPQVPFKDMDLGGELLYLQKSIPMADLKSGSQTFTLTFGGNIQTTNTTLEVDPGRLQRFGHLLSYNKRFHFYNSKADVYIGMPETDKRLPATPGSTTWHIFIKYDDGNSQRLQYVGYRSDIATTTVTPDIGPVPVLDFITVPTLNVTSVIMMLSNGWWYYVREYSMKASSRYNYSINDTGLTSHIETQSSSESTVAELLRLAANDPVLSVIRDEADTINVTEQFSPFVFRVEHSYKMPGTILDLQPQMVAVTDVSYGDYPLNVFTTRGTYALLQGSGTVLYGNIRPISNLVSEKNSIPTESGTFFIAVGGLWLIAGNHAVLVSDALHLGPHTFVRNSDGYDEICRGAISEVDGLESNVRFEEYVQNAALAYNRYRDEIIVSNPDMSYSYVLSLKYRQWFKISDEIIQDTPGSQIARRHISGNAFDLIDFYDEAEDTTILVHLQSRPFSMGFQYSHIHRLLAMIRADLVDDNQTIIVALYGSDDLQNWKLLSYAHRENATFSQIRTAPAARSWRYYTITISGKVGEETDFGPVLVDYAPVIRRLG